MDPDQSSESGDDQMETTAVVPKRKSPNPNWADARAKAAEARRQIGAISRAKKLQAKLDREAEYKKALAILNPGSAPKPAQQQETQPFAKEESAPQKEEDTEEEEEEPEPPKKKAKVAKAKPMRKARTKVIEISESSSSSSEDSSDDDAYDVVRVVRKPKSNPPKTAPKRAVKRALHEDSEEDEEAENTRLAGAVARDLLKRRVLAKAAEDAIKRLVPTYRGSVF